MGERQSDGSARGRRRVHPDGMAVGAESGPAGPALELLLAAAIRETALDAEGEQRAVAAFRAARDAGVHQARTRRRDDWRPREQRRTRRSLKATLTMALASLTLGGVAVAAIGSVHSSDEDHDNRQQPGPSATAPDTSAGQASQGASGTPGRADPSDRPSTAQDTEAHCRAYQAVKGHGKAMDATVWQRLIEAAGGEQKVAAYCAEQLAQAGSGSKPARSGSTKKPDDAGNSGEGAGGANGGSANDQGNAGNATGGKGN
ncbi:hypothetical protein [Streptomyces sp. TLI_185]|uniref:hypothetical protein n=1 Tax=Streptomyces sp. TLI_185 TaxID=2485151 RepID=UPI000F4F6BDE|nr:hypothetical protein [Streptomyces sp. TLI_185]RPF35802.1 hypothetical protein EDD92_5827 [Streptomyces sp. TLI_185]